jgi:hypothetical protein
VQLLEVCHSIAVAEDCLAVDDQRARTKPRHGLPDERITLGPVEAVARKKAYPALALAGDDAIAVVLDS